MPHDWKCGKCGKEYTSDEFLALPKVKLVEDDTDPIKQYGYTSVCSCGYVFHRDRWHKTTEVEIQPVSFSFSAPGSLFRRGTMVNAERGKVRVSSVFLELDHQWDPKGPSLYYETMIFLDGVLAEGLFQERYETQEQTEKRHDEIVRKLSANEYKPWFKLHILEIE